MLLDLLLHNEWRIKLLPQRLVQLRRTALSSCFSFTQFHSQTLTDCKFLSLGPDFSPSSLSPALPSTSLLLPFHPASPSFSFDILSSFLLFSKLIFAPSVPRQPPSSPLSDITIPLTTPPRSLSNPSVVSLRSPPSLRLFS